MAFDDGIRTVSGSIATFNDGTDEVPCLSVACEIKAQSSGGTPSNPIPLTGITVVSATRTGKNILPISVDYKNYSLSINGMTLTVMDDGRIRFNGTTTAATDFAFYRATSSTDKHLYVKNGTYTVSCIGNTNFKMIISGGGNNGFQYREITNGSFTSTVTDETKPFNYIIFRFASDITLQHGN